MKKIFCILLFVILVISFDIVLAEQSSSDYPWVVETVNRMGEYKFGYWEPPTTLKEWRIGVSVPHFKSPLWVDFVYGIITECDRLGLKVVNVSAAKGYDDLSTQITQIEDMVTLGIDALILAGISYEGNAANVEWVRAQGVKAIIGAQSVKSLAMSGLSCGDPYYYGRDMAEWINKDSGGKANVVVLCGPAGASFTMDHLRGISEAFAKYPGIKIVAERWGDIGVPQGQNLTEDLISSFPNEIDYIIGTDVLGQGAANAVQAAGLQGKIKVVETWGTRETLSYVKDGRLAAFIDNWEAASGIIGVDMAVMHMQDDMYAPVRVRLMSNFITKDDVDNLDTYGMYAPEGWTVPSKF